MLKTEDLNLKDTLSSGQCFRFSNREENWTVTCGVAGNVKTLTVSQNRVCDIENDAFFSHYFDLENDYSEMKKDFAKISPVLSAAVSYAPGIRILNQDSWEALCSFVVSQNNNIKRIMGIISRMCSKFTENGGFPTADTLAGASEQSLKDIGLGFRASYIINTATAVADGTLNLEYLKTCKIDEGRRLLMSIKGIGPKVADCALLFGCHRLDCFPMDVWMKRVMSIYFPGQDYTIFGPYAGVAQQYLFHWIRTCGVLK